MGRIEPAAVAAYVWSEAEGGITVAVISKGFHGRPRPAGHRLPPGQYETRDFPVLAWAAAADAARAARSPACASTDPPRD
jgi:hypothetical protein